jgi:hypothetical protein
VARDALDRIVAVSGSREPFAIGLITAAGTLPLRFAFPPPAPNPFLGGTRLGFDLPEEAPVRLEIFGVDGSLVRVLADGEPYPAGRHVVAWDGSNDQGRRTGAGVYFIRIAAGAHRGVQKVVRLR